jgi:hypothetical protein
MEGHREALPSRAGRGGGGAWWRSGRRALPRGWSLRFRGRLAAAIAGVLAAAAEPSPALAGAARALDAEPGPGGARASDPAAVERAPGEPGPSAPLAPRPLEVEPAPAEAGPPAPLAPRGASVEPGEPGPPEAPLEARPVEVEPEPPESPSLPGLARPPEERHSHAAPAGSATFLDTWRVSFEEDIGSVSVWLDRFFGAVQYLPLEEPSTYFRLRGDVAWRQVGGYIFGGSVIAQVRLPALTRWFSRASVSVVGGRAEPGLAGAPSEIPAIRLPSVGTPGGAIELRYDLLRAPQALLDLGAGLRFRWPLTPYVRLRWLQAARIAGPVLLRITPSAFWERDQGFGLRMEAETHVEVAPTTIWRTRLDEAVTQLGRGVEWYGETGVQQLLGPRTVVYPAVSSRGATADPSQVDLSRVFVRLRQDLYRMWVYGEIEPEVLWHADASGTRTRSFGVILRLELQFASLGSGSRWGP